MNLKMVGIVFVTSIGIAHPQNLPPESLPEFEVASVRPVPKDAPAAVMSGDIDHGKITLNNAALRQIIGVACSVQRIRVEGGPKWLDTELYQIVAKTPILGLVNALANMLHNPVIDKTGLSGAYDFTLGWETGNDDFASVLPDVLEGMGLRIDSKKNLTEVLVIDGAERPSGN